MDGLNTIATVIGLVAISLTYYLPVRYEIWDDRKGETAKDKIKDFWKVSALAAGLAGIYWWLFDINPLISLAMVFSWRFLLFDYQINKTLYRNHVIEAEAASNAFKYVGKTSKMDKAEKGIWRILRLWNTMNPWLKLGIRIMVFVATLFLYFYYTFTLNL